ncbi:alpha/beta hydrolase family esterase [Planosporangium sp. 12N6]|uniref:alpha/beta hydrolase family esterase n=1 Tax=Planosporangium spinosum TaxID=3402278 RepID=UPI003CF6093D
MSGTDRARPPLPATRQGYRRRRYGCGVVAALALVALVLLVVTASGRAPLTPAPAVAALSAAPLPAGWTQTTVPVTVGGLDRSYLLIRPRATVTGQLPVLVELHGCCVAPHEEAQRSGFVDVTRPAILVYPAGVARSWNAGFCCHRAQESGVDDVAFLTAVVTHVLATQADAASGQVYLAGYSNGGKMALRMACEAPGLFAAVASYGAVDAMPCPDPAPVSLLEAASTDDPELSIRPGDTPHTVNGYTEPTVEAEVDRYRQADGCPDSADVRHRGSLTVTTWTGCDSGRIVQLALYRGGGHGWPQGDRATPSAAEVIWGFFLTARAATRRGPG